MIQYIFRQTVLRLNRHTALLCNELGVFLPMFHQRINGRNRRGTCPSVRCDALPYRPFRRDHSERRPRRGPCLPSCSSGAGIVLHREIMLSSVLESAKAELVDVSAVTVTTTDVQQTYSWKPPVYDSVRKSKPHAPIRLKNQTRALRLLIPTRVSSDKLSGQVYHTEAYY